MTNIDPSSGKEYTGIFDLPPAGGGLNDSERLLAQLCRKSFLSLWAYPNLHTDEGFVRGRGAAKEFTDMLLVFGDHVVLFSDKHVPFNEEKPVDVAWPRWYKRAVASSMGQLYGAAHWLKRFPNRIFLDARCTRPLPVKLPDRSRAHYHLVAVTRGSFEACSRWFPGSLGTLQIRSDVAGRLDPKHPFTVGRGDPARDFVHILDEYSLRVILEEFDTAPDFIAYLRARASFLLASAHLVIAAGEEQLVAAYLLNMRGTEHWFTPSFTESKPPDIFFFDESHYPAIRDRPEYRAKKLADGPSYFWDGLIEQFIRLGDPAIAGVQFVQDNSVTEEGLRILASEGRFRRRMLADALREAFRKAVDDPTLRWMARTFTATEHSDRVYIFLIFPKSPGDDYRAYREYRLAVLHAYCKGAKLRFLDANTFIGIAFDHPLKDYAGGSEDLFIYRSVELADEERAETERHVQELGILRPELEPQFFHTDEFPGMGPKAATSSRATGAKADRNRSLALQKGKRKMTKDSRRRNRRKK